MTSYSLIKYFLAGSAALVICATQAQANTVPKNSLDLANWAQQANDANKRQSMSSYQAQVHPAQPQASQVSYNPYSAMARQVTVNQYSGGSRSSLSAMPKGTQALRSPANYSVGAANFTCVRQAAFDQQVPLRLMLAINSIERGRYNQKVSNKNTSYDIGQFQINSIHLGRFSKFGASEYDISNRGCYNAQAAAYLLSAALREPSKRHLDIFTRASGYHSWTPKYNAIYRKKLITYLKQWDNWMKVNNIPSDIQTV